MMPWLEKDQAELRIWGLMKPTRGVGAPNGRGITGAGAGSASTADAIAGPWTVGQPSRSIRPAAPMPPPMHIVTRA